MKVGLESVSVEVKREQEEQVRVIYSRAIADEFEEMAPPSVTSGNPSSSSLQHVVEHDIRIPSPLPVPTPTSDESDERRKLAKRIIKQSAEEVLNDIVQDTDVMPIRSSGSHGRKRKRTSDNVDLNNSDTTRGPSTSSTSRLTTASLLESYTPRAKAPRAHYNAAVACMARRAALSGHTTSLVRKFSEARRDDCDSLAAYHHLLSDTRRQLTNLDADPGESFAVWVAVGGLREAHRRWYAKLVTQLAAGGLDWDTLMAAMAGRACQEKQPAEQ
ncbi:hypothetical protein SEUCBS139899_003632 [Sporothrix eucalyptigena]